MLWSVSHQVTDMYDTRDFAARRRGLPGRADRIVNRDGDSCSLLADGATDECVTGGHCAEKKKNKINTQKRLISILTKSGVQPKLAL